eukprot:12971-Eustigmatos_ZCMA.PRE.1
MLSCWKRRSSNSSALHVDMSSRSVSGAYWALSHLDRSSMQTTDDDLKQAFERFGTLVYCKGMTDKDTN